MRALRRQEVQAVLVAALVVECAVLAFLVLNPSAAVPSTVVTDTAAWLAGHGVPAPLADGVVVEFVLNAAMFAPIGATLRLLVPRVPWWAWGGVGFAGSGAIELTQLLFLDKRSASWVDVWANTLGFALGAALVAGLQLVGRMMDKRRHTRLAVL